MPELGAMLIKFFLGAVTCGVGWWLTDLRSKQARTTQRTDAAYDKINKNSDRLTKLESETISEAETMKLIAEMERRSLDNFKEWRSEYRNDFTKFGDDLRGDIKDLRNHKD